MSVGQPLDAETAALVTELRQMKAELLAEGNLLKELNRQNEEMDAQIEELTLSERNLRSDLAELQEIESRHQGQLPIDTLRNLDHVLEYEADSQEKVRQNAVTLRLMAHELLLRTIMNERVAVRELASQEAQFERDCNDAMRARKLLADEVERMARQCEGGMLKKRDLYNELEAMHSEQEQLDAEIRLIEAAIYRMKLSAQHIGAPVNFGYSGALASASAPAFTTSAAWDSEELIIDPLCGRDAPPLLSPSIRSTLNTAPKQPRGRTVGPGRIARAATSPVGHQGAQGGQRARLPGSRPVASRDAMQSLLRTLQQQEVVSTSRGRAVSPVQIGGPASPVGQQGVQRQPATGPGNEAMKSLLRTLQQQQQPEAAAAPRAISPVPSATGQAGTSTRRPAGSPSRRIASPSRDAMQNLIALLQPIQNLQHEPEAGGQKPEPGPNPGQRATGSGAPLERWIIEKKAPSVTLKGPSGDLRYLTVSALDIPTPPTPPEDALREPVTPQGSSLAPARSPQTTTQRSLYTSISSPQLSARTGSSTTTVENVLSTTTVTTTTTSLVGDGGKQSAFEKWFGTLSVDQRRAFYRAMDPPKKR
ncbi:unnamed protein product, partial [Mesorhabditis spiculigera]